MNLFWADSFTLGRVKPIELCRKTPQLQWLQKAFPICAAIKEDPRFPLHFSTFPQTGLKFLSTDNSLSILLNMVFNASQKNCDVTKISHPIVFLSRAM